MNCSQILAGSITTSVMKIFLESILSILADTAGSLWLGTVSGLYRYDIEKEEFIFFTSLFSGEDYEDYASDGYSPGLLLEHPRVCKTHLNFLVHLH